MARKRNIPNFDVESVDLESMDADVSKVHLQKHETEKWSKAKNHIMSMNYQDNLYISPDDIPDGMEYYWVSVSCLDKPDTARIIEMERRGWSAVPASRHPDMASKKSFGKSEHADRDYIYYKGLVLYERPKELCDLERAKVQEKVDAMESHMPAVEGGGPAHWRRATPVRDGYRNVPRAFSL